MEIIRRPTSNGPKRTTQQLVPIGTLIRVRSALQRCQRAQQLLQYSFQKLFHSSQERRIIKAQRPQFQARLQRVLFDFVQLVISEVILDLYYLRIHS